MQWEWSLMTRCHVQAAQEEEGSHAEGMVVPVSTTGADHAHQLRVHALLRAVGDGMPEVADDIVQSRPDHLRHLPEGLQAAALGPADPGQEETAGRAAAWLRTQLHLGMNIIAPTA
jgi:hypothetical protein